MLSKEKIKERVSVSKIFEHFEVEPSPNSNKYYCPFHDDNRPSITVKDDVIWSCWPCSITGDVIKFVELKLNLSFTQALKWFESYLGYSNKKIVSLRKKDEKKDDIKEKYSFYFLQIENKISKEIKKKKDLHPKTSHATYCELDSYDVAPKNHKEFEVYKKELFNLYKKVKEL